MTAVVTGVCMWWYTAALALTEFDRLRTQRHAELRHEREKAQKAPS